MKIVEKVMTYDGVEHDDYLHAKRHLEEEFGRRVTALGHKFAPAGVNYKLFTSMIEEALPMFAELIRIKNPCCPPGPERWKERSRFFPGIAAAMADQWAGWACNPENAIRRAA